MVEDCVRVFRVYWWTAWQRVFGPGRRSHCRIYYLPVAWISPVTILRWEVLTIFACWGHTLFGSG